MSLEYLTETYRKLSPEKQKQLDRFLAKLSMEDGNEEELNERIPLFGALKGKIWMAPDFDEPLEDFKDYM